MKTPIGLLGLSSLARLVSMRLAIIARPWFWPMMRRLRISARWRTVSTSSATILPTGNAGPVGNDGGDRLLVDVGVDHALVGTDVAELADLGAQRRAGGLRLAQHHRALRRRDGCDVDARRGALGFLRRRRRRDRRGGGGRLGYRLGGELDAQGEDFLDQRTLLGPVAFDRRQASRCLASTASISPMRSSSAAPRITLRAPATALGFQRRDPTSASSTAAG